MSKKNNFFNFRSAIILVAVILSVVAIMPTYQLYHDKKQAEDYFNEISLNTTLTQDDIKAALSVGNLELLVRDTFKAGNGKTVDDLVTDVEALSKLDGKILQNEPKAIKLGLDLQGGTYLVYEVDLPQLLVNLTKETNNRFETALQIIIDRVNSENEDFFEVLPQVFTEQGLQLNHFFGRKSDSDSDIINGLKDEAEDAVERTLEVLRNRIDQFGVSEPSITKQGNRRIVVELAGIHDIERAKNIIGTTALLEFQMESAPEVITAVRNEINRVMKRKLAKAEDLDAEDTAVDSSTAPAKIRKDTEVSLESIFGESSIVTEKEDSDSTAAADPTVLIDEEVFSERPFDALLADLGGDIGVPTKNVRAVERILNSPEVQEILPADTEFLFFNRPQRYGEQEFYRLYMVKKDPELTGDMISNANHQMGSQMQAGKAVVGMELTGEGAKKFARVTGANVGKRMAIVLDNKIVSIPNIQERIPSGNAQITGMDNIQEAMDLAIVLRAGALPAPIEVIEERTVGPSLGQDSIDKGTYSMKIGLTCVLIFMIVYYRFSGLVATIALLLNIFFIMAALAFFHATLTLPGLAGIILTIGMAVDANVLIFERIREKLGAKDPTQESIGNRAMSVLRSNINESYFGEQKKEKRVGGTFKTLLDANVTTLIAALVLASLGTGPIKGFAITLATGICTSLFSALVFSKFLFDILSTDLLEKSIFKTNKIRTLFIRKLFIGRYKSEIAA